MDSGVSTHTVTDSGVSSAPTSQKLVLRVKEKKTKITWTDETVDNEHMNKKSSKSELRLFCCIFSYLFCRVLHLSQGQEVRGERFR